MSGRPNRERGLNLSRARQAPLSSGTHGPFRSRRTLWVHCGSSDRRGPARRTKRLFFFLFFLFSFPGLQNVFYSRRAKWGPPYQRATALGVLRIPAIDRLGYPNLTRMSCVLCLSDPLQITPSNLAEVNKRGFFLLEALAAWDPYVAPSVVADGMQVPARKR
ncbi:hypothetical protein LX32DRAFT_39511 [Colletotrichum zoysiae]|uniref:Uncharacterized protein n=1 Tax=Colletotrichum zoysiae TaxID=1216348 RepID=A0AAD9HCQ2_9PEZI|nr:hypothetical protein LX32DRAFT_39511 [Colletotrichum zoysiae]